MAAKDWQLQSPLRSFRLLPPSRAAVRRAALDHHGCSPGPASTPSSCTPSLSPTCRRSTSPSTVPTRIAEARAPQKSRWRSSILRWSQLPRIYPPVAFEAVVKGLLDESLEDGEFIGWDHGWRRGRRRATGSRVEFEWRVEGEMGTRRVERRFYLILFERSSDG